MKNSLKIIPVIGFVAGAFVSASAQNIPLDPAVRTGKLLNGFTYYIRNNNEPQKRANLYLVNKVGSVMEDADQQGLAHFMEHMNFNGTKNFPKNELVDYLQKAGVRFGADLNAYTSFDETVYELPVPTDDPTMTANAIRIMRDWAQEATLDPAEIEKERGVILEEERLGKGAGDRMARKYYPVMLNHSRYAERLPIGIDSILTKFKPAVIKRFHHDWYRPDLQALIIVGDVNVNEVEKMIKAKFSDLKNPANERARTKYSVALTGNKQFLIVTDKETPSVTLQILYKHKAPALITEADYIASMKSSLLNQLLGARRYAEISREPKPAYVNMNMGVQDLLGGLDMFAFDVTAKTGQLEESFAQTWRMLEKVKRYGFSPAELDRAKKNYLRSLETGLKEIDKTPSTNLVKEYQRLFLKQEASPGIAWEYAFAQSHINDIGLADILKVMNECLDSKDVDMLVMGPEKEKANLPDQATLSDWINKASKETITPFKDEQVDRALFNVKLKAGRVTSRKTITELNLTELVLSNGLKVILKPTAFKNDEIRFNGFSAGGTSLYTDTDYDNAANAAALVSRFGLGELDPVQLARVLNGKVINVAPGIGSRSQTISGVTTPADLETALQLAYLEMTQPRKDSLIYNNTINSAKDGIANRYSDPNSVFADSISYVMGNYSYRAAPPSIEKIDRITLDKAYDIYKERFADASGFTFVFVGNFEPEKITPLLEKYLGALPSLYKNEKAIDLGTHIPAGRLIKKVFKGKENKALVRLVFSGDYSYSPVNNLLLKALGDVLQIKVLQQLREAKSEVYSPGVQTSYNKFPKNRYAVIVSFGCAPENADHLIALVEQEMAALRDKGPDADDIQKFKAAYEKNVELALNDNSFWLGYLSGQYENGEDVLQALDTDKNLAKVTPAALLLAAKTFLSNKNMIRFELLPEAMAAN
jgi:zinc protease